MKRTLHTQEVPPHLRPLLTPHTLIAPLTTLGVGGEASLRFEARTADQAVEVARWAHSQGVPLYPIGGGSNILCADEGVEGALLTLRADHITYLRPPGSPRAEVIAEAGAPWQTLVDGCVARGWAGVECLAGIPGLVGAAPIQNIGAYGQSLSDTCARVCVYDLDRDERAWWGADRCDFGYRTSRFKREPGRYLILGVALELTPDAPPTLTYTQLAARLSHLPTPTLQDATAATLALRAEKSMLLDPRDPNHKSAGSFFVNPTLSPQEARALTARAEAMSLPPPPTWPEGAGVKVPAAWLIERAGCAPGYGAGAAGLSTRHTLALVNRGGATARDLIRLAQEVQARVLSTFGVRLQPEVNLWGFNTAPLTPPPADLSATQRAAAHIRHTSTQRPFRGPQGRPRVALATCATLPPWERDDAPLSVELEARGVAVIHPRWDDPHAPWERCDLVIPRTTWDYQGRPEAFAAWLTRVSALSDLQNPAPLLLWNLNKTYLRDLRCPTPPTEWLAQTPPGAPTPSAGDIAALCATRGWARAFLKPTVAANAHGTLRLNPSDPADLAAAAAHLAHWLPLREMILQPYNPLVETIGERSLIYFNGRLSHAVQKIPRPGDYRVQDDHGATDLPWEPPRRWLDICDKTLAHLPHLNSTPPLYARCDMLTNERGDPELIELEMIEPSLFFRHDPLAASRFADAIVERLTR
jgi:UDP-N-acetylmuramate dehydrogenase